MIQVLDKYGNTNNDEGRVLVFDKDGNIKRVSSGGSGTVTSVSVTSGTGISASVATPTTTPNITITNTAPDQTVVLTNGTGISVTGTYPSFTITNTSPSSGGTVTGVTATSPITSSGGTAPVISTSMATNKLIGRYSSGTGVMEEISVGSGLTLTGAGILNNTATPTPLGYYGAFSDVTDQFAAVINTGYPMLLGITDLSNQVTVVSGSRVTIANAGIYNIQWSAQFRNPTAAEHDVTIWLRKNGVDVAGSAGVVSVPKKHGSLDGHTLPSWNFY